jgi:ABC-type multidrug transport system ATPase subunit
MLRYSVELRLKPRPGVNASTAIDERVDQLVQLLNLGSCKGDTIALYPEERGETSGDMRRLSIAIEIADLPPVIVIDEPTLNLDVALSMNILICLHELSRKGHAVVCSMSKPFPQEMELVDRLVLLSEGYTVYSGAMSEVRNYFASPALGYDVRKDIDIAEFLIDVSNGTERPINSRAADIPLIMQQKFEESEVCVTIANSSDVSVSAFSEEFFYLYGYGRFEQPWFLLRRLITATRRAFYAKTRDFDQLKFNFVGPVFIGCFYGYLNFGTGSYGNYCMQLFNLPYPQTTNISGLFFFTSAFSFMIPHVTSHAVCKKIDLFRYEQSAGITTSFAFLVATLVSEMPFYIIGSLIFSILIYSFTQLGTDTDDYEFYAEVLMLLSLLGVCGSYMFGLLFRKELLIRDLLLITVTLVAMLSGFPVQIHTMYDYIQDAAGINPIRWSFEGLLKWKFSKYKDGEAYLLPYGFNTFNKDDTQGIINNFMWVTLGICIFLLPKAPIFLKKEEAGSGPRDRTSKSRDSMDSVGELSAHSRNALPRKVTRQSELAKPVLFMRESSVVGTQQKLSISVSQTGETNIDRGPTVAFKDLNFRVIDRTAPGGYRIILNRVAGQFDWGKLSMVMGATGSGKSTLMHILAGDIDSTAEVTGKVYFNEKPVDKNQPLWQRCGFVPIHNEHLRDLTVQEVVRYAMLLR